jgi:hypothetical protein
MQLQADTSAKQTNSILAYVAAGLKMAKSNATGETMIVRYSPGSRRLTLGADKAYDVRELVGDLRDVTPPLRRTHLIEPRRSTPRTTRHRVMRPASSALPQAQSWRVPSQMTKSVLFLLD